MPTRISNVSSTPVRPLPAVTPAAPASNPARPVTLLGTSPGVRLVNAPPPAGQTRPVPTRDPITREIVPPPGEGLGKLAPTAASFPIPASLKDVVRDANEALNLDVLNADFNPLKSVIGPFTEPSQVFQGKLLLPTREILGGALKGMGPQGEALLPILAHVPERSVLRTPAHQYNLGDKPGNRVVFYGGAHGHADLDKIITTLGSQGIRIAKQMVHFGDQAAQGGSPKDLLGDGVGGSTHVGGFSSGILGGEAVSIKSDWPSDYGTLDEDNTHYNANLLAIDYQAGVEKEIPLETKLAYKSNADMWDALLGMMVPFASSDPDPRYTNYKYNPLDLHDQASLQDLAQTAARTLNWNVFKKKFGAFYCGEGQWTVANLGPNEASLLKKSQFEDTKIGKLIEEFQKAPGLTPDHPEIGWKHLVDTGLIKRDMYKKLEETGRLATPLAWVDEKTKGWQAYNPLQKDGLVAAPMTVGTLAWSLMRRYMPRDAIASQLSNELTAAYQNGDAQTKAGIHALLGGNDPTSPQGKAALGTLAFKASVGFISSILGSEEFKRLLFRQAGFEEITNDADKAKVADAYQKFVNALGTATNQLELDRTLKAADDELRGLIVERTSRGPNRRSNGVRKTTMLYSAPPAFGAWAQQGFLAGTGDKNVFQYIATAMHAEQEAASP